jgi:hypothetical protein
MILMGWQGRGKILVRKTYSSVAELADDKGEIENKQTLKKQ